ncbi:MAG: four helix bundle protein [Anaerolineales bacterium]|nr:four helix bundle protein [Anaerolineales bacterium]
MTEVLPKNRVANIFAKQIIRSATSVGANYRAACRAKSTADMVAKLAIVEEESDETLYWLELIAESNLLPADQLRPHWSEMNEILSMTISSIKTLKNKSPRTRK